MLALLLYHVGQAVRIDTLVEVLWDDTRLVDRRDNLYALASRIRAVLGRAGLADALVHIRGSNAYRLEMDPNLIDFHRFRRMVAEARDAADQHHDDIATALLAKAVALWRDEPLADLRGTRVDHLRRRMTEGLLDAHKLLATSQLRVGQHHSVLVRLEPLIQTHELDETVAQLWVSALCAAGRESDARTFFTTFRRRFRKEMQTEPAIALPWATGAPTGSRGAPASGTPTGRVPVVATGPRQLPNDISDFTGHADLLARLDTLTDLANAGTNVVVIHGMPGAGKTTLVTHWAHQRRHRFPDGELYLNASAYGPTPPVDPTEALGRFLHAFDVPADRVPLAREQRRDRLNQILGGRRVLVVLDNVQDSAQARALIPGSARCVTLITSRNRLRGLTIREGVRSITVPPLPEPECLALLDQLVGAERARAEPDTLRAMANLSGGLPLALRIIGEHVAERPHAKIADLVVELGDRLLDAEDGDDEDASLRTMFAWSYNALTPDLARLFRVLGLHPGSSIGPEAAAAMLSTGAPETELLLDRLAKVHMLNHDTARRYRFHDLLHRYAMDRAERDDPADWRHGALSRLLDWYLLSCTSAITVLAPQREPVPDLPEPTEVEPQPFGTEADAMSWCEMERTNLLSVTRWAVQNGFYRHGWQIPNTVHEVVDRFGRQDDVRELQELAVSAARLDGHRKGQIGSLNNLGTTYFALHDYRRAATTFEAALQLARDIHYVDAETACFHNLASVHLRTGDTATAVRIYEEVLGMCRDTANASGEAATLHRLGAAYRQLKRYDEATRHYLDALAIRERIGSLREQGATHGELAALYFESGHRELALEHCRSALDFDGRSKDDVARCDALITLADIERDLGRYTDAVRDARRAVDLTDELADPERRCRALAVLADALAATGSADAARRMCREALAILADLADLANLDDGALRQRLEAILARR